MLITKAYDVFDPYSEIKAQRDITMYHYFRPSVGLKYYGLPKYIGATKYWVPLLTEIPKYHLSILKNSLSALYHVEIPLEILERLRAQKNWTQDELDKWVADKLNAIDEMLTGSENAGKTIYSNTIMDSQGKPLNWKITPIDNKAKQLSEGYLKLYNDGNQAITSAMQVQPSLACIQLGDKMSSGSEVLNAYNLHMQTRTPIPRKIVLKALTAAIKINFPDKDIYPAFDNVLLVQQDKNKSGVETLSNE